MELKQYGIFWVNLEPIKGHEMGKKRPCVVISPDEMNRYIKTVMIAPITTKSKKYPTRVQIDLKGKECWIVLDQIRTVDRERLENEEGMLSREAVSKVKRIIKEMLVD